MDPAGHLPVLLEHVLRYLEPAAGATIVDATVGLGGHSVEIARRLGPEGLLIAVDQDPSSLEIAKQRVSGCRVEWVHGNFAQIGAILANLGIERVDGVLADLGVSSPQLDVAERGFSFRSEGPLDMRMDPTRGEPASRFIDRLTAEQLARIFWEYGEERFSRRVAARIVERRRQQPFRTTSDLAEVVRSAIPHPRRPKGKGGRRSPPIDPATRVFQALRIAVNDELGSLDALMSEMPHCVKPGGRAVIISFHSLEDRRVKQAFRDRQLWENLTKKPCQADEDERQRNPRARSAKLRAARRQ